MDRVLTFTPTGARSSYIVYEGRTYLGTVSRKDGRWFGYHRDIGLVNADTRAKVGDLLAGQ